jgi:hypothetical protein
MTLYRVDFTAYGDHYGVLVVRAASPAQAELIAIDLYGKLPEANFNAWHVERV